MNHHQCPRVCSCANDFDVMMPYACICENIIKILIISERRNRFIIEELETAIKIIKQESGKPTCCSHLVRLASTTVHADLGYESGVDDARILTLWHEWSKQEHLQELYEQQEDERKEDDNVVNQEESLFR